MAKFKVGDTVKVIGPKRNWYNYPWMVEMNEFLNQNLVIKKDFNYNDGHYYRLGEENHPSGCAFHEETLELIDQKPKKETVTMFSWLKTNSGTYNITLDGKSHVVSKDHLNYSKIGDAIKKGDTDALAKLVDVTKTLNKYVAPIGGIEIRDGMVFKDGKEFHHVMADRLLTLYREGYPVTPLVNFINNLMQNPSKRAVDELYLYLEHKGLPLTPDGCFLSYKRVRPNFTDEYSGKIDFSVGKVVEVPRNTVDDNWRMACSSGIHSGNLDYVRDFHPGDPVIIVKINPKDVVSVPSSEVTKLRTCKLEVVQEFADRNLIDGLTDSVYCNDGTPYDYDSVEWDDFEEDEEEDDYNLNKTGFANW